MAYVFRRAYGWRDLIPDGVFFGLSRWLALFALLFVWMQLQQNLTGSLAPPAAVEHATTAKMEEPLYWLSLGMVGAALAYLAIQTIFPRYFNVERTVAVAVLPVAATLLEKTLFVLEVLMHPVFSLYQGVPGSYTPSWMELSSVVGAVSILLLFFLVVSRVIPLLEVEVHEG